MSKITRIGPTQPLAVSGHVPAEVSRFRVTPFGLPPNKVQTYGPDPMFIQEDGTTVGAFAGMAVTVGLFAAPGVTACQPPQYRTSVQWSALEINYNYLSEDAFLELTLYLGSDKLPLPAMAINGQTAVAAGGTPSTNPPGGNTIDGNFIPNGNCTGAFSYSYSIASAEQATFDQGELLQDDVYYSFTGSSIQLLASTWSPC